MPMLDSSSSMHAMPLALVDEFLEVDLHVQIQGTHTHARSVILLIRHISRNAQNCHRVALCGTLKNALFAAYCKWIEKLLFLHTPLEPTKH